jgi:hypothetical protein
MSNVEMRPPLRPPLFYLLAKINEELGDTAKAVENYERFLDLWKDADPSLSEVDEARQRLSRLENAPD